MNIKDRQLIAAILAAGEQCTSNVEEEGGIILYKDADYVFARVKNIHEGTTTAAGLYETDLEELKAHVLSRVAEGWKFYASFHTHPSFSPTPSSLDLTKLFQGFKYNVIYSPKLGLFSFNEWMDGKSITYYISYDTLTHLAQIKNEH